MSVFLCKLFLKITRNPGWVIGISLALSIAAIPLALSLKWEYSLLDLFSEDSSWKQVEKDYQNDLGSQGVYTILLEGNEKTENHRVMAALEDSLNKHPSVSLALFQMDSSFLSNNFLLYQKTKHLHLIRERAKEVRKEIQSQSLLFAIPMDDSLPAPKKKTKKFSIIDSLDKYLDAQKSPLMRFRMENSDGTLSAMRILPRPLLTNYEAEALDKDIQSYIKQLIEGTSIKPHYSGELYYRVYSQGKIEDQLMRTGMIAVSILMGLLLIYFFRQPLIPLLGMIPSGLSFLWTMGVFSYISPNIHIISILLLLLLFGLGAESLIHLLSRYGEERRKQLGPYISLENVLLETGPAIVTANLTTAGVFLATAFLPLEGFRLFGTLAAIGITLQLFATMTILPAFFIILQKRREFKVYGSRLYNYKRFRPRPFSLTSRFIAIALGLFLVASFGGLQPQFDYNFSKAGIVVPQDSASRLLEKFDANRTHPVFYRIENNEEYDQLSEFLESYADSTKLIYPQVYSTKHFLPSNQKEKLDIIQDIPKLLPEKLVRRLDSNQQEKARFLISRIPSDTLDFHGLPVVYQRALKIMFSHSRQNWVWVWPRFQPWEGRKYNQLHRDLHKVQIGEKTWYATGSTIVLGDFLQKSLAPLPDALFYMFLILLIIIWINYGTVRTLYIIVPLALGSVIFIGLLNFMGHPINPASYIIIPLLIGFGVNGTIHLISRFQEEGSGSLFFVMRRTAPPIILASIAAYSAFIGFLFSEDLSIRSIGIVASLGLFMSLFSSLVLTPLVLSFAERNFWRKQDQPSSKP